MPVIISNSGTDSRTASPSSDHSRTVVHDFFKCVQNLQRHRQAKENYSASEARSQREADFSLCSRSICRILGTKKRQNLMFPIAFVLNKSICQMSKSDVRMRIENTAKFPKFLIVDIITPSWKTISLINASVQQLY